MEDLFIKCEYCGNEFVRVSNHNIYCSTECRRKAYAQFLKEFRKRRPRKKKPYESANDTLCWKCQNATGGCSWSQELKPVEGWVAKKTKIRLQRGANDIDSFIVRKCPEFIPDER
jgi:hypothetical protein